MSRSIDPVGCESQRCSAQRSAPYFFLRAVLVRRRSIVCDPRRREVGGRGRSGRPATAHASEPRGATVISATIGFSRGVGARPSISARVVVVIVVVVVVVLVVIAREAAVGGPLHRHLRASVGGRLDAARATRCVHAHTHTHTHTHDGAERSRARRLLAAVATLGPDATRADRQPIRCQPIGFSNLPPRGTAPRSRSRWSTRTAPASSTATSR